MLQPLEDLQSLETAAAQLAATHAVCASLHSSNEIVSDMPASMHT